MKISSFLSAVLVLTFVSCNNVRTQVPLTQETPKALADKSTPYEIVSKRGYDDLVESLYSELVNNDIELKRLEGKIDELNNSKNDSIEPFRKFNGKIEFYFSLADKHVSEISDSLLRNKMKLLVASNLTEYDSRVAKHNELLDVITARELTISDLHKVLKIVKTLPVIEKYQKDNLPNRKSLEGFVKQQDQTINLADTLINR